MDLSIVVVSFNTRTLTERCLASLAAEPVNRPYEVVVVDNASADGSAEMVASTFPGTVLIRNRANRGFARAVNQAIGASTGRYVLLLNSDATLLPDAARHMMAYLDAHPQAGAIGGRLLNPDGSFQGSYADFPTVRDELLLLTGLSRWLLPPTFPSYGERESQDERAVDWVCGAFMMLRRAALEDVGLFDEEYFMYAEELDWCYRARQRGWVVGYTPDAQAMHLIGGSYRRAPIRRRAQLYRSKRRYLHKHHGRIGAALFSGLVRACSAAKLVTWALCGMSRSSLQRDRARRNVASYRYLLCHF